MVINTQAKEWHVSTAGKSGNPGTEAKPFDSLTEARDAIRSYRKKQKTEEAHTVIIHEGNYQLSSTFYLNKEDGGTKEYPVIYRAADGEIDVLQAHYCKA